MLLLHSVLASRVLWFWLGVLATLLADMTVQFAQSRRRYRPRPRSLEEYAERMIARGNPEPPDMTAGAGDGA